MSEIRRPTVVLPPAPQVYDQREQNEFRRILMNALGESVQDLNRPSLSVEVTPSDDEYEIIVTWTGTMTYTIDGGAPQDGTTSPQTITVTRNEYLGAAIVYVFSVVNSGQTTSATVTVPAVESLSGVTFSLPAQEADSGTNRYYYSWTVAGMPSGTTYNLLYRYTNTAGTLVESGTVTNATSGDYVSSTGSIGVAATYSITVDAVKSGVVIATLSRVGNFVY